MTPRRKRRDLLQKLKTFAHHTAAPHTKGDSRLRRNPRSPAPQHSRGAAPYQHRRRHGHHPQHPNFRRHQQQLQTPKPQNHHVSPGTDRPGRSAVPAVPSTFGPRRSASASSAVPSSTPVFYDAAYSDNLQAESNSNGLYISPSPTPLPSVTPSYNTAQPNVVVRSPASNTAHTIQSLAFANQGGSNSYRSPIGSSSNVVPVTDSYGVPSGQPIGSYQSPISPAVSSSSSSSAANSFHRGNVLQVLTEREYNKKRRQWTRQRLKRSRRKSTVVAGRTFETHTHRDFVKKGIQMRIQGHKRKVWTVRTLQIRSEDIDTPTDGTETYFSFPHQERRKKCLFYHAFFSLSSFPAAAACCCVMAYLYTCFFASVRYLKVASERGFFCFSVL